MEPLPKARERLLKMPRENSVTVAGRLVRDLELAKLADGRTTATFPIACNEKYKLTNGETKQTTLFVRVCAVGGCADYIAGRLRKGDAVFVKGKLGNEDRAFQGMKEPAQVVVIRATTVQPLEQKEEA